MITLPSSAPADILASTGTIFNDLWPVIALAIGVPLAFYIIGIIIRLVSKKGIQEEISSQHIFYDDNDDLN